MARQFERPQEVAAKSFSPVREAPTGDSPFVPVTRMVDHYRKEIEPVAEPALSLGDIDKDVITKMAQSTHDLTFDEMHIVADHIANNLNRRPDGSPIDVYLVACALNEWQKSVLSPAPAPQQEELIHNT